MDEKLRHKAVEKIFKDNGGVPGLHRLIVMRGGNCSYSTLRKCREHGFLRLGEAVPLGASIGFSPYDVMEEKDRVLYRTIKGDQGNAK